MNKPIVVIGMMGVGKTTIAKLLADYMRIKFIDIDEVIVEQENKSIPDIFKEHGESYFRGIESSTIIKSLNNTQDKSKTVISTGGGAVMNTITASAIWDKSLSIWLYSDIDTILKRIGSDHNRPLLQQGDTYTTISNLEKIRLPVYRKADIHIDTGTNDEQETLKIIIDTIKTLGFNK
jgi:shikimate kinase